MDSSALPLPSLASLIVRKTCECRTSHNAARIACVELAKGEVVVAAGGSCISATYMCDLFPVSAHADGSGGSGFAAASSTSPHEQQTNVAPTAFSRINRVEEVLAARQKQLWHSGKTAGGSTAEDAVFASAPSSMVTISSGCITCLAVSALPGAGLALGIAGTTAGVLCVFLIEGNAVSMVAEISLTTPSRGLIGSADSVQDGAIGLDPAGRPEFIAAATRGCLVIIDAQELDGPIRAAATEAALQLTKRHQGLPTVRRDRSEGLVQAFPQGSGIVRVLAPERLRAAFAMEVALVLVLVDGTMRYVARHVRGGSVQLLREHHAARQIRGSYNPYEDGAGGDSAIGRAETDGSMSGAFSGDSANSRALPHVVYNYSMPSFAFNVSRAADGIAYHDQAVVINDAVLYYNAQTGRMDLVLAGTQTLAAAVAAATGTSGTSLSSSLSVSQHEKNMKGGTRASSNATRVLSAVAARMAGVAPGSPIEQQQQQRLFSQAVMGVGEGEANSLAALRARRQQQQQPLQRVGWWAIARNVVLPQGTLATVPERDSLYGVSTAAVEQASMHTIHVRCGILRTRQPTSSGATGSSSASTAAASSGGGVMTAQDGSSGLSTVTVLPTSEVALLASGADLYVGVLKDSSSSAETSGHATLRQARSCHAVVQQLAALSGASAASLANGAKAGVVCAAGGSLSLLTV